MHLEKAPDNVRVAGEPPLPVAMADHRDGFAILFGERPAEHRANAEHRVVIARHQLRRRELDFTVDADMRAQKRTERSES